MSEHAELRDLLGPYVMGSLGPEERREVEEHLRRCPSCSEEAQELRFAHERLMDLANTIEMPSPQLKERVMDGIPRREPRRVWLAAAAVLLVLVALGVLYSSGLFGQEEVAAATLQPTDLAPHAGGEIRVYGSGENMDVQLNVWGMPPCKSDEYYELWFAEGEERVSGGSFTVGPSGRADVKLNAPRLASAYPQVGVTKEVAPGDPRASDKKMLGGELRKL